MRAFADGKVNRARERIAQARAAFRELLETHFSVVTPEVIVGSADDSDHFGFSISDL